MIRRVLWRWEQPQPHRFPRTHTIWSPRRNRESLTATTGTASKNNPLPVALGYIYSMVRPHVPRYADETIHPRHPSSARPLHLNAPIGGTPIQSDSGRSCLSGQHPHPHNDDSSRRSCQAAPRSPRFAWRRAAQHPRLRLARRLPSRRLQRLSRCRAAPRSPRLTGRRAAQHYRLRLARRPPLRQLRRLPCRRAAPRSPHSAWRRAA